MGQALQAARCHESAGTVCAAAVRCTLLCTVGGVIHDLLTFRNEQRRGRKIP